MAGYLLFDLYFRKDTDRCAEKPLTVRADCRGKLPMSRRMACRAPGRVEVMNRQRRFKIYCQRVACFCAALLEKLKQPSHALSVVFISARRMRLINRHYRQRDYATDVLSFSYPGILSNGIPYLGEVLISPEVASHQALRYRVDPEKELRRLLVHGVLHLLGYDHEKDRGRMRRVEANIMRQKFFRQLPALADMRERQ